MIENQLFHNTGTPGNPIAYNEAALTSFALSSKLFNDMRMTGHRLGSAFSTYQRPINELEMPIFRPNFALRPNLMNFTSPSVFNYYTRPDLFHNNLNYGRTLLMLPHFKDLLDSRSQNSLSYSSTKMCI